MLKIYTKSVMCSFLFHILNLHICHYEKHKFSPYKYTQNINKIIDHLGQYDKIIQSVYVEKYRDFNLTFVEIKNYKNRSMF
jgi:hypothetical protein